MRAMNNAAKNPAFLFRLVRLWILFVLAVLAPPLLAAPLPASLRAALAAADIPPSAVGVVVQRLDRPRPTLAWNTQRPFNPASVMKLITTYAALDLLGPAHTWRTELLADGPLAADGVLAGNLHVRGSGDPRFTQEALWLLLRQLRARGVHVIRGDLVLDRSRFAPVVHDPAAFDGQPLRAYNVGPDALMLAWKALQLRITAEPALGQVLVWAEPESTTLRLDNRLRLADGPCNAWRDDIRPSLELDGGLAKLVLEGRFPTACGEKNWSLGALDHAQFFEGVFRALWTELDGHLDGRVRDGAVPDTARLLAWNDSAPLAEQIRDINKWSNNVMARQLYLALGAADGVPADAATAEARVGSWLAERDLYSPGLVLDNGSGLSRAGRWSAGGAVRLLAHAWASPFMPEFLASLPIYGTDGTLRSRNGVDALAGRAHLKGGTLDGVSALAGYLQDRKGRRWALALFINHPNAGAAKPVQDALLEWIDRRP